MPPSPRPRRRATPQQLPPLALPRKQTRTDSDRPIRRPAFRGPPRTLCRARIPRPAEAQTDRPPPPSQPPAGFCRRVRRGRRSIACRRRSTPSSCSRWPLSIWYIASPSPGHPSHTHREHTPWALQVVPSQLNPPPPLPQRARTSLSEHTPAPLPQRAHT